MSTGEHVDEQPRPRRASERRSSLQQIEELKVRRASERRASVELSAELRADMALLLARTQ